MCKDMWITVFGRNILATLFTQSWTVQIQYHYGAGQGRPSGRVAPLLMFTVTGNLRTLTELAILRQRVQQQRPSRGPEASGNRKHVYGRESSRWSGTRSQVLILGPLGYGPIIVLHATRARCADQP